MLWLAAAASGLLLYLTDYPVHAWRLGIVALVPMLVVLARATHAAPRVALAAIVFSLAYALPLSYALEFTPMLAAGQVLIVTALWTIAWLGVAWALRLGPLAGALAAGAFVALVEWANFTLIPIWGTAQSFVRTWSAWPPAMQSVWFWGMSGLVFQVVAVQALTARALVGGAAGVRWKAGLLAAVLLAPLAWGSALVQQEAMQSDDLVTVAAIGWVEPPRRWPADKVLAERIEPLVAEAVQQGAELVVTPEFGLVLGAAEKQPVLERLAGLAGRHHVRLAIGYFDADAEENHIAFLDTDGRQSAEYAKTHLVPFVERYRAGRGKLAFFSQARGEPRIGGMICQDDNFTDLGRAYGSSGADIVVVPTNDWREVAPYHLENSRFRAVENGYAIVRAASNGTSAIVSPRGIVLARMDHFVSGAGVIVAAVPYTHADAGLYTHFDAWIPFAWLAVIAAGMLLRYYRVESSISSV